MNHSETYSLRAEDLLLAIVRRWKLVLAVTVAGAALSAILASMEKPLYEATAKLMVNAERARITVSPDPKSGTVVDQVSDQDLNSEVALLQSKALLREVLEPYRQEIDSEATSTLGDKLANLLSAPIRMLKGPAKIQAPTAFDHYLGKVAQHLEVSAVKASNLIDVKYTGGDPAWAANFVNRLTERHVNRHAELNQQTAALEFLESQRSLLADKVRAAEAAMTEFYRREGVDAASAQRTTMRARMDEIESTLAVAEIEMAEAQAGRDVPHAASLGAGAGAAGAATAPQDALQSVRAHVLDLQLQRADQASKLAPTSLKLQMLDQQIAEAQRLLQAESKRVSQERIGSAKARVTALKAQLVAYRDKLHYLDQIAPEGERLEQELAASRESYLTYSKKVEEARFSNALDQSHIVNVSVVEKATEPAVPLPSRASFTLLMGMLMSLGSGLGLALLLGRLDPTVETAAGVEQLTGFRTLVEIPSR